jgi:hypothetical protein
MFIKNEQGKKMNKIESLLDDTERKLLEQALKTLNDNVFTTKQNRIVLLKSKNQKCRADLIAEVIIDSTRLKYCVELKKTITKADKSLLSMQSRDLKFPTMLITKYVNPEMAEELKQAGIEFADTAGNVFFNQPPVLIFIKGNKLKNPKKVSVKRAFKKVGLKIIYALLVTPGLENATYREIAKVAGVSLGSVDLIMSELKEMGYLRRRGDKSCYFAQKDDLVKRWVQAYPEQLRPKLNSGIFRGSEGWWKKSQISHGLWGGEIAAQKMTDYLNPEVITIYCNPKNLDRILLENRLRKDPDGNVEILEEFWNIEHSKIKSNLVHPLLVYADLIASGDPRNVEVAEKIYEQYVTKFIRED